MPPARQRGRRPSRGERRSRPAARRGRRSRASRDRSALRPAAGSKLPGRLIGRLGEVARAGDPQALRVGDDERAGRVGAAEPLLAGDREEVEASGVDGNRADGLGAVDEHRHAGLLAELALPAARGRSSRAPARARAGASCGVTAARIASGSGSTATTRAPLAWTGPSSPKCSSVVVTISSSGCRSRPARTMLQPSVVEPVSAICSGAAPTRPPSATRACLRRSSIRSKYSLPKRPSARSASSCSCTAAAVGRASGPNVPAFRYASRSSTGKSDRASSGVTRSSSRRGRGPTAPRHCADAARRATPRAGRASTSAATMWSMFGPGRPGSRRLKSPASTRAWPGAAIDFDERVSAGELGARHLDVLELVRRVDIADDDLLEPDRVTHAPLSPLIADPDRAVLERDERRRQQDRVRLAGDSGAKARRVVPLEGAAEPARQQRPLRDGAHGRHPAPLLELRERPERQLLQAEHVRPVPGGELDHLAEIESSPRRRGAAVVDVPAANQHGHPPTALAYEPRARRRRRPPSLHAAVRPRACRLRSPRREPTSSSSRRAFASATVAAPDGYRRRELFYPLSSRLFGRSRLRVPLKVVEHPFGLARLAATPADVVHVQWLAVPRARLVAAPPPRAARADRARPPASPHGREDRPLAPGLRPLRADRRPLASAAARRWPRSASRRRSCA